MYVGNDNTNQILKGINNLFEQKKKEKIKVRKSECK